MYGGDGEEFWSALLETGPKIPRKSERGRNIHQIYENFFHPYCQEFFHDDAFASISNNEAVRDGQLEKHES